MKDGIGDLIAAGLPAAIFVSVCLEIRATVSVLRLTIKMTY